MIFQISVIFKTREKGRLVLTRHEGVPGLTNVAKPLPPYIVLTLLTQSCSYLFRVADFLMRLGDLSELKIISKHQFHWVCVSVLEGRLYGRGPYPPQTAPSSGSIPQIPEISQSRTGNPITVSPLGRNGSPVLYRRVSNNDEGSILDRGINFSLSVDQIIAQKERLVLGGVCVCASPTMLPWSQSI